MAPNYSSNTTGVWVLWNADQSEPINEVISGSSNINYLPTIGWSPVGMTVSLPPTPTPTMTPSPTRTPTLTPTNTPTLTPTQTPSITPTLTQTPSLTPVPESWISVGSTNYINVTDTNGFTSGLYGKLDPTYWAPDGGDNKLVWSAIDSRWEFRGDNEILWGYNNSTRQNENYIPTTGSWIGEFIGTITITII